MDKTDAEGKPAVRSERLLGDVVQIEGFGSAVRIAAQYDRAQPIRCPVCGHNGIRWGGWLTCDWTGKHIVELQTGDVYVRVESPNDQDKRRPPRSFASSFGSASLFLSCECFLKHVEIILAVRMTGTGLVVGAHELHKLIVIHPFGPKVQNFSCKFSPLHSVGVLKPTGVVHTESIGAKAGTIHEGVRACVTVERGVCLPKSKLPPSIRRKVETLWHGNFYCRSAIRE